MKAIQAVSMFVALSLLYVVQNVRIPKGLKIEELCADIAANGLKDPIVVVKHSDGRYEICQGHRRDAACRMLEETDPETFNKRFPDGVPVEVWEGLSDAEILLLKLDAGNTLPLSNVFEAYLSTKFHFQAGSTEADIATGLAVLYDRTHRPKARYTAKIDELNGQLTKETDPSKKDEIVKQIRKENLDYRKGLIQGFKNIYDCPKIVERAHFFKNVGDKMVGFEDEDLPKGITAKQTASLKKAHIEDMETVGTTASKDIPGDNFWAKWAEVMKEDADKNSDDKPKRAKSMSASDLEEELKTGKYSSELAQMLTRRHAGQEVNGADVAALDHKAFLLDLVLENGTKQELKAANAVLDAGDRLIKVIAAKAQKDAEAKAKAKAEAEANAPKEPAVA